ncbi:NUDIX domain-containing protein [Candidatus Woesearchaeota archaeon]|nr:NUDIX domain-containing protein [Candidatus Woesearchaeota archaeon]
MPEPKFAPREIFEQILEWSVIPTFDLIIQYGDQGVIIVKRTIPPYKNQWALTGLRMLKGESIEDTLQRIAKKELGLDIDSKNKRILGQYVGRFKTEHQRQDISTGYLIQIPSTQPIILNPAHFSAIRIINSKEEIPSRTGAMYKFFLEQYFNSANKNI